MSTFWVVLVFITTVSSQSHDFDMSSCSLSMTCGSSTTSENQEEFVGVPGRRGEPGLKGEPGEKGDRGDSENNTNEFANIRQQISALNLQKKCPRTKYYFPNFNQVTDYIRIKSPIPEMRELTICTWLTPASSSVLSNCGFVSYSTSKWDNTILLYFYDNARFHVKVNNEGETIKIPRISGRTHLCVTLNRTQGQGKVYTNGLLRSTSTYKNRDPIIGGGAFLIGQEQDSLFGSFDRDQAYTGTIENFTKWYRVLSLAEISNLYYDPCRCSTDYAVALSLDEIQLEGKVLAEPTDKC